MPVLHHEKTDICINTKDYAYDLREFRSLSHHNHFWGGDGAQPAAGPYVGIREQMGVLIKSIIIDLSQEHTCPLFIKGYNRYVYPSSPKY